MEETKHDILPLRGVTQHYAWGGRHFLPEFLGLPNAEHQPWAEYWMGTHAKGPARLDGRNTGLDEAIAADPRGMLGPTVAERFADRLPFLFKVLDVQDMLSIQVHPDKKAAEAGFAREERNGPDRSAPNRNYRDDNHKPELGVAVTDFYLLHGFRKEADIRDILREIPGWEELLPILKEKGVSGLYAHVMYADQAEVDRLLQPLVNSLAEGSYDRSQPDFWARRAVDQYTKNGHHDRGMFSVYWFNLVHLQAGEGIFQDAGIPHAYLEGVCLELMANSDNVLRGGLTPKHIDVPELLDKTRFDAVRPDLIRPVAAADGWQHYPTPAPDFELSLAEPAVGESITSRLDGPSILLVMEGKLRQENGVSVLSEGSRTAFVPAGRSVRFTAEEKTIVYRAGVGDIRR